MKMRRLISLLLLSAVTSTAAVCPPPKPPTPPVPQTRKLTLWPPKVNGVGLAGCQATLKRDNAPTLTGTSDGGFGTATWPGLAVLGIDGTTNGVANMHLDELCPGFQNLHVDSILSITGDQDIFLNPPATSTAPNPLVLNVTLTPTVAPLPPVPSRDQLARVHACFQGIPVQTSIGLIPSWGPEVGMLGAADRQLIYAAHKKAGCTHFVIDLFVHYTEGGVSYPNGTAASNDWTNDPASFQTIVAEIVRAGMYPVVALGADELPFSQVVSQVGTWWGWLRSSPQGDLTGYCVALSGFDSIVPIGNANDDAVQSMLDLVLAIRNAIGPSGVQAFELPNGWAFMGPTDARFSLAGAGTYTSPAGQAIDVWLQEFDSPPGPPQPAPAITGATFDAEHNDYAPIFADPARGTSFQRIWQVGARTVRSWTRPADEPTPSHCTTVHVTDGPNAGGTACVFADVDSPGKYDAGQTPRGRTYWIAFELATFSWTHGFAMSSQDIVASGSYFTNAGYDEACVPVAPTPRPVPVSRPVADRPRSVLKLAA